MNVAPFVHLLICTSNLVVKLSYVGTLCHLPGRIDVILQCIVGLGI